MSKRTLKAFTLIELLIVVAIIAILAAIAVPNFLEAQVRSKVSRAKADMRSIATAVEAYYVDNNAYPKCNPFNVSSRLNTDPATAQYWVLERLSTPISYMTSALLPDPFPAKKRSGTINPTTGASTPSTLTASELQQEGTFKYLALATNSGNVLALVNNPADKAKSAWCLWSAGPTLIKVQVAGTGLLSTSPMATEAACVQWIYDPTNGTISNGGIFRVGGMVPAENQPGGVFIKTVQKNQK